MLTKFLQFINVIYMYKDFWLLYSGSYHMTSGNAEVERRHACAGQEDGSRKTTLKVLYIDPRPSRQSSHLWK